MKYSIDYTKRFKKSLKKDDGKLTLLLLDNGAHSELLGK